MSPELEKRLIERFPRLYIEYHKSPQETCMCWGFDHGDGWFDLIWMLSLAIEDELKQHADPNFAVVQVKEKFGGLRYYINGPNERIHKLVALTERASELTCEVCGGWGKTRRRGCWLKTLCEKDATEFGYECEKVQP